MDSSDPALVANNTDAEFRVLARGELVASELLPITLPGSVRMSFRISWMAPEFSDVRKGDVIARFDDTQIRFEQETTALKVAKSDFKLANTNRAGDLDLTRIGHESQRVEGERDISEAFADADERLLSRNEMIDTLADIDYLDAEAAFLEWQSNTFDKRTQAERNMIIAEREGDLSKLQKQEIALQMMELRSPADGTFVYARTRWGNKLRIGKTVYPGMPIGLLPVRGRVKARLYVPENDAVGLANGQLVRFRLDSVSDREFTAYVEAVSPVASPRNRRDLQKFFSVEAIIDDVDPALMRVGSSLRAEIITGSINGGIVVPAHVVYGDMNDSHVYVLRGRETERRTVKIGRRSPDLVELTAGVTPGDRISLVEPADQT
jgi:multidrug efflux pump subunit AcrA (membrane-fusion protein)